MDSEKSINDAVVTGSHVARDPYPASAGTRRVLNLRLKKAARETDSIKNKRAPVGRGRRHGDPRPA
jgi:hypothetical protein